MNQDNIAQSNPDETVVVEEAAGVNPDGDSKTAPVLEKQDIETTEKVNYGLISATEEVWDLNANLFENTQLQGIQNQTRIMKFENTRQFSDCFGN